MKTTAQQIAEFTDDLLLSCQRVAGAIPNFIGVDRAEFKAEPADFQAEIDKRGLNHERERLVREACRTAVEAFDEAEQGFGMDALAHAETEALQARQTLIDRIHALEVKAGCSI